MAVAQFQALGGIGMVWFAAGVGTAFLLWGKRWFQ